MRHGYQLYAEALAEVIGKEPAEKSVRANLLALLRKNGDMGQLPRILTETERLLMRRSGRRRVTIETARPPTPASRTAIKKLLRPDDLVEERIAPGLVAGVRMTVDDELQWDGSLARKIRTIFAQTQ